MIPAACVAPWDCKSCANGRAAPRRPGVMPSWLTAPGEGLKSAVSTPNLHFSEENSPRRHKEHKGKRRRGSRKQRPTNELTLLVPTLRLGTHVRTLRVAYGMALNSDGSFGLFVHLWKIFFRATMHLRAAGRTALWSLCRSDLHRTRARATVLLRLPGCRQAGGCRFRPCPDRSARQTSRSARQSGDRPQESQPACLGHLSQRSSIGI